MGGGEVTERPEPSAEYAHIECANTTKVEIRINYDERRIENIDCWPFEDYLE